MKKSTLFKNLYNTSKPRIPSRKHFVDNIGLTIKNNKIIFYKLFNTDGNNLKNKEGEYYFDFDDDYKKFKDIKIVVFDVDKFKHLNIKIYNKIYIDINNAQIVNYDNEEDITSTIIANNILRVKETISISSDKYKNLFTNKNKDILYYFASNDEIIYLDLKKYFGVDSIDFKIKEENISGGGKRKLKSYK